MTNSIAHDSPIAATIVVAGATGDMGDRVVRALLAKGAKVKGLVRDGTPHDGRRAGMAQGAEPVAVDYDDTVALARACAGAACVVSVLNGIEPVILGAQGRLLDAAVAAGVPRFIPSDFSLDFTKTRPGDNRNMDLRRAFSDRIDRVPIRATSILNGAFADLLTGGAPIILHGPRKVLYWGSADQPLDFTTKDDVARYVALAALDDDAPRCLRIAGDVVTPRALASIMTSLRGRRFGLWRAGGIGRLSAIINVVRALTPGGSAPFPIWQGLQYLRDMSSGRGKLAPLDNDRYGVLPWASVTDVLRRAA